MAQGLLAPLMLMTLLGATLGAMTITSPVVAQPRDEEPTFSRGDELVHLDFKDAELTVVIETIARITGRNFIYDDRVRGRVTIVSPTKVSVDQAFAVFESVLKVKGFTAVPGPGGILKIIPIRDAKESSIETIKDNRASPFRDTFVTRLVPLLYIDAEAITSTIKPLVSKEASMVAYSPTNTIIITDTQANIRRLLDILEAIDVETYKEELAVLKVKYADAATLGKQLSEIYGAAVSTTSTKRSSRASSAANRRASNRNQETTGGSFLGQNAATRGKVRIITDDRTNSLLVLASRTQLSDIRSLVQKLDVPLVGGGRIHVYYLRHADAEEMATTLNGMLSGQRGAPRPGRTGSTTPGASNAAQSLRSTVTAFTEGITLNADPATNSLVIQASKESYEALTQVIEKLDIPRPQVLVEALIMEVDITEGLELGFEVFYQTVNGNTEFAVSTAEMAFTGTSVGQLVTLAKRELERNDDGSVKEGSEGSDVAILMRAAAKDANLNVVSSPHILTSDNEEAEIRIGNNIPIVTSRVNSATGNTAGLATSVNVERQDIGVTLRVTPQISEGDTVRLKIFQEITDINYELTEGVGDPEQVGVSLFNRKVENTVVVKDGETVVVGGLISDRWIEGENKVPWLGDIPVLGWAFKTVRKDLRKINLLIFLTPHIIRTGDDLEFESIRKRQEFENSNGDNYKTDAETIAELERTAKKDDKWAPGRAPVLSELRKHESRYSIERKQELDRMRSEVDEERRDQRLRGTEGFVEYALRVSIYQDEGKATRDLTMLLDAGYDGTLMSGDSDGALVFELVLGPFPDLQAARDTSDAISEVYGFFPAVTIVDSPDATISSEPRAEPAQ